jgi:soluble lytic murein transglycosylase-like protein
MEPWAELIWKVGLEEGVPAELIAAIMKQESGGRAKATNGSEYGHGLMQVEFSAWSNLIPGQSPEEKRQWILNPEHNVRFAVRTILKPILTEGVQT